MRRLYKTAKGRGGFFMAMWVYWAAGGSLWPKTYRCPKSFPVVHAGQQKEGWKQQDQKAACVICTGWLALAGKSLPNGRYQPPPRFDSGTELCAENAGQRYKKAEQRYQYGYGLTLGMVTEKGCESPGKAR